jgi:hypothetical protein
MPSRKMDHCSQFQDIGIQLLHNIMQDVSCYV